MQLPVKAHYATLAMLALAEKFDARDLLQSRVIAREQKIPMQFLGQILQQLRAAGLVHSTRGSSGGFSLERSPSDISIAEIVDSVCSAGSCSMVSDDASPFSEVVYDVWEEVRVKQRQILERVTLDDLLQRAAGSNSMFYI